LVVKAQLLRSEVHGRLHPLKQLSVAQLQLHGELHHLHLHLHLYGELHLQQLDGELQLERPAAWDSAPLKMQDLAINRHQCFVPLRPLVKCRLSAAECSKKKAMTIDCFV